MGITNDITCKKCGVIVKGDVTYCPHCGEFLLEIVGDSVIAKAEYDKLKAANDLLKKDKQKADKQLTSLRRMGYAPLGKQLMDIDEYKDIKKKADKYDTISMWCFLVGLVLVVGLLIVGLSHLDDLFRGESKGLEIKKGDSTGKYGIYNHDKDQLVTPYEYDTIKQDPTYKFFYLYCDSGIGVADSTGTLTIPCDLDSIRYVGNDMFVMYRNGMQGVCNRNGHIIIPCENQYVFWEKEPVEWTWEVPSNYIGNIIPVKRSTNSGWDIYDNFGKRICPTTFQEATQTALPNLIKVKYNELYGLIDNKGNSIVSCNSIRISRFREERAFVDFTDKENIIDSQGNVLCSFSRKYVTHWIFSEGLFAKQDQDKKIRFYNEKGKSVFNKAFEQVKEGDTWIDPSFHGDSARISYQGQNGYVFKDGSVKLDAK